MKKKNIFIIVLIAIAAGFSSYYILIEPGYRVMYEPADFTVTSDKIAHEFIVNEKHANQKYDQKVMIIKGKVSEIHGNSVIIGDSIVCLMSEFDSNIKPNQMVSLKGKYIGFDDFMNEIRFDHCSKI